MCSRVPLAGHSWQVRVSTFPQVKRFAGLDRTSYTAQIWKAMRCGSLCQSSVQVTLRSMACSHVNHCFLPGKQLQFSGPRCPDFPHWPSYFQHTGSYRTDLTAEALLQVTMPLTAGRNIAYSSGSGPWWDDGSVVCVW